VWHALDALGCGPDEALLIGDSATDVRTARAAGVEVWAVTYGYQTWDLADEDVPDRFIDHFDEIDAALHPAGATASGTRVAIV
jgi:phosphoglycolate phosphatase